MAASTSRRGMKEVQMKRILKLSVVVAFLGAISRVVMGRRHGDEEDA